MDKDLTKKFKEGEILHVPVKYTGLGKDYWFEVTAVDKDCAKLKIHKEYDK